MNTKELLVSFTGGRLKEIFAACRESDVADVFEVRVRADKPLILRTPNGELFIGNGYKPSLKDISDCVEVMSNHSLYAFQEEIKNGFITLRGGHRVGVSGRAVFENGAVKMFKGINGMNVRIARQVKDCGLPVMKHIDNPLRNTLVISPPGRGKTTLLRDIARLLSNGGRNVGVVDERSEIAGVYMGVAQNDVGIRTDVLDGCPKGAGMLALLRAMSPDVIVVDEIGGEEEARAVCEIVHSGVKLLCAAHGKNVDDISKKPALSELFNNNVFERFIVLSASGRLGEVEQVIGKR